MSRRAVRRAAQRCYAILGVLAENGPTPESELCRLLRRPSGTLFPDLAALEHHGRVTADWERPSFTEIFYDPALLGGLPPSRPRRRIYRLPTPDERAATRALENRLRAALHAATDPLEPGHG